MKVVLIFISPNGTTKSTTQLLGNVFSKNGHQVEIHDIGMASYRTNHQIILNALEDAEIVGFGSPVYHMDILEPSKNIIQEIVAKKEYYNYQFASFIYINYAGITSGKAFINTLNLLKNKEIPVIGGLKISAPHFHHNGRFPKDMTRQTVEEFYKNIENNHFKKISWEKAKKIFSPDKLLVNILYPFIHLIGDKRELSININNEKCKKCQRCIKQCPVGAIIMDDTVSIDFNKCIHCYHCVITCPFEAVECQVEKLDRMIELNKKIIGTEEPCNKIYI